MQDISWVGKKGQAFHKESTSLGYSAISEHLIYIYIRCE
jgi:hypothetical protein